MLSHRSDDGGSTLLLVQPTPVLTTRRRMKILASMKLAFTTLGCPGWNVETIARNARKMGFLGMEVRGYMGNMNVPELPEFTSGAAGTRRKLEKAGLELYCFASSARIFRPTPEERAASLTELKNYLPLCKNFGAKHIRILGGDIGDTPRDQAIERATDLLGQMVRIAAPAGITLLLETHDSWTSSAHVRTVLERVNSPNATALWDIQHPFRANGEKPEDTWRNIGPRVQATHWKDFITDPAHKHGFRLCLMGEGEIPLREMLSTLVRGGYDGYLTFEWEKKWYPELAEPEIAFPQYTEFMRQLVAGL